MRLCKIIKMNLKMNTKMKPNVMLKSAPIMHISVSMLVIRIKLVFNEAVLRSSTAFPLNHRR